MSYGSPTQTNVPTGGDYAAQITCDDRLSATHAAVELCKAYSRERPEVIALWAFGIGFVLGWKLKPW